VKDSLSTIDVLKKTELTLFGLHQELTLVSCHADNATDMAGLRWRIGEAYALATAMRQDMEATVHFNRALDGLRPKS
jgi:hypothetical protein